MNHTESALRGAAAKPPREYIWFRDTIATSKTLIRGDVLFKPTKAAEYPFRPTAVGALSYFVGGDAVTGGYSEDAGFAHNGGLGWSDVEFKNVQVYLSGPVAVSMGHYIFTQATGDGAGSKARVEFTFGYKRDAAGVARIFVHHSSAPYTSIICMEILNYMIETQ